MSRFTVFRIVAIAFLGSGAWASRAVDAPAIDRSRLTGRLFFTATDPTSRPTTGNPLERRLYVMPANASTPPKAITSFAYVVGLIGYPQRRAVGVNVFTMEQRGSFLVDATPEEDFQVAPALPAETAFLFESADPGAPSPLDPARRRLATQVSLSPDGKRVAGVDAKNRVCIVPVDGHGPTLCAQDVSGCPGMFPAWSPDGAHIAFQAGIKANLVACNLSEVFVMDTKTGSTRQLTDVPGKSLSDGMRRAIVKPGDSTDRWHKSGHPAWSPDGHWIAFSSSQGVGRIHPDGSDMQIVARGLDPAWSPDGSMLAYRSPRTKGARVRGARTAFDIPWSVFVCRADGSAAVEITTDDTSPLTIDDVVWME